MEEEYMMKQERSSYEFHEHEATINECSIPTICLLLCSKMNSWQIDNKQGQIDIKAFPITPNQLNFP